MIYIEIGVQLVAILVGVTGIYNKKVLKKAYEKNSFILLALAIFYSKDSPVEIIHWLVFIVAFLTLIIMFDNLFSNIRRKHNSKKTNSY